MRALAVVALLGLSLVLASGCSSQSAADEITVTGSTTIMPIAEIAAEKFHVDNPDIDVLVSSMGSSVGIQAVSKGTSDIGTSSRDLKPEEEGLGLVDTPIAYDGIAVIVNPNNPITDLTTDQLQGIFSGRIKNWKELGGEDRRIDLVNRDEASGTREAFNKIVMGDVHFDPRAAVLPGTGQVRDVVARSEGAIGYISVGFVEPRFNNTRVKAVTVDGVTATEETVASGEYPISRVLHFFTKGEPTGLAKQYIEYVLSEELQQGVVVDAGFVPVAAGEGAR